MGILKSYNTKEERVARARELLEAMAKIINDAGVPAKAYRDPQLPVFTQNTIETQEMLIDELQDRVEFFMSAATAGENIRDTRQMLWRSLRKAGWVPSADVFEAIEPDDTVEIYSLDMKQVFRNIEFFKWISYTLEEIHGGRWNELTTRDEKISAQLMEIGLAIATGRIQTTVDVSHIPSHVIQETTSLERRKCIINMKVLSPVFRDGQMVAIIAVNRTEAA